MSDLIFKEDTHQYFIGDRELVATSKVLEDVGITDYSMVPRQTLEWKAYLGKYVHRATHLMDINTLDESTIIPEAIPYLNAWNKFIAEHNPAWWEIEKSIYSKKYLFATTPDRIGFIDRENSDVEIKCTATIMRSVGPQTASHCIAYNEDKPKTEQIKKRYCVLLKPDGTYKFEELKDKRDERVFLNALYVYNWKGQK